MTVNAFGVNTPRPSPAGCLILILLLIVLAPVWLILAVLVIPAVLIMRLTGIRRTPKNAASATAAAGGRSPGKPERGCSGGGNPPASEDIIDVRPLSDDK